MTFLHLKGMRKKAMGPASRAIKGRGKCKGFRQDHAWQAWEKNKTKQNKTKENKKQGWGSWNRVSESKSHGVYRSWSGLCMEPRWRPLEMVTWPRFCFERIIQTTMWRVDYRAIINTVCLQLEDLQMNEVRDDGGLHGQWRWWKVVEFWLLKR